MATHGNKRKFYLSAADSSTYEWLTGEQSNNFNLEAEMLESTDKSSNWKQFVSGMKGATAEVTVFADSNDEQQDTLLRSLFHGEKVFCFIGELNDGKGSPAEGDIFEAYVSSISTPNENGSLVTRSVSLQVTGEVVHVPTL